MAGKKKTTKKTATAGTRYVPQDTCPGFCLFFSGQSEFCQEPGLAVKCVLFEVQFYAPKGSY